MKKNILLFISVFMFTGNLYSTHRTIFVYFEGGANEKIDVSLSFKNEKNKYLNDIEPGDRKTTSKLIPKNITKMTAKLYKHESGGRFGTRWVQKSEKTWENDIVRTSKNKLVDIYVKPGDNYSLKRKVIVKNYKTIVEQKTLENYN